MNEKTAFVFRLKDLNFFLNAKALLFVGIKFSTAWVHRTLETTALPKNTFSHFILWLTQRQAFPELALISECSSVDFWPNQNCENGELSQANHSGRSS